ncbi:MAG: fluoride efflux transporter CrcB [Halodesulfurarchaeum sp.]
MVALDPAHIVGLGGAVGAILRQWVSQRVDIEGYPTGTFTVNVIGTFLLGTITFLGVDSTVSWFFGVGLCGSFTTFSSFSFETVRLWETEERWRAVMNSFGNLLGAGLAIGLSWLLVQALAG